MNRSGAVIMCAPNDRVRMDWSGGGKRVRAVVQEKARTGGEGMRAMMNAAVAAEWRRGFRASRLTKRV